MQPSLFRALAITATAAASLMAASPAAAALASIAVVPTAWRLQNYIPTNVVVWFTGVSGCGASQGLSLEPTASADDRNRFWSTIMTGKTAGKAVYVYYETTTCVIASFGLLENG